MPDIYLLLGSNLGDSIGNIGQAIMLIEEKIGKIEVLSSLYKTAAWGLHNQPDFINQVIKAETILEPLQLLERIVTIESLLQRTRSKKWGARTIDVDILFYGKDIIEKPELTIPHAQLHNRRFTLMPLMEIAPDLFHPKLKRTITELFQNLTDTLSVQPLILNNNIISKTMLEPIKEDSQELEINLSYLSDIASGSSEFMIEMIDMFLEQTPGYVAEMSVAIDSKNWSLVADIAHKIKPTFAFMGLESAKDSMAEIEGKARTQSGVEEIDGAFKSIQAVSKQLFVKLERVKEDLQQAG